VIAPRAALLPQYDSPAARCLLLAIAGQESGWSQRLQEPVPFARGFWQCEKLGGVLAVVTNEVTRPVIYGICNTLCIPLGLDEINEAIAWNDTLAYWVARLFLWMDPPPLPAIGDTAGAYETYLRVWRPGKRNDATWPVHYGAAAALFTAAIPAITETQPEGQAT
jgi:hypothetical protein